MIHARARALAMASPSPNHSRIMTTPGRNVHPRNWLCGESSNEMPQNGIDPANACNQKLAARTRTAKPTATTITKTLRTEIVTCLILKPLCSMFTCP